MLQKESEYVWIEKDKRKDGLSDRDEIIKMRVNDKVTHEIYRFENEKDLTPTPNNITTYFYRTMWYRIEPSGT